jgi:hypothetical protein
MLSENFLGLCRRLDEEEKYTARLQEAAYLIIATRSSLKYLNNIVARKKK